MEKKRRKIVEGKSKMLIERFFPCPGPLALKPLKFVWGLPEWKFLLGKKIRKSDFAPPPPKKIPLPPQVARMSCEPKVASLMFDWEVTLPSSICKSKLQMEMSVGKGGVTQNVFMMWEMWPNHNVFGDFKKKNMKQDKKNKQTNKKKKKKKKTAAPVCM